MKYNIKKKVNFVYEWIFNISLMILIGIILTSIAIYIINPLVVFLLDMLPLVSWSGINEYYYIISLAITYFNFGFIIFRYEKYFTINLKITSYISLITTYFIFYFSNDLPILDINNELSFQLILVSIVAFTISLIRNVQEKHILFWKSSNKYHLLSSIITIIGVILVVGELQEQRRGNDLLYRSVSQTYRPLIAFEDSSFSKFIVKKERFPTDQFPDFSNLSKDEVVAYSTVRYTNIGQGLTTIIGTFTCISQDKLDFGIIPFMDVIRKHSVILSFDTKFNEARLAPLKINNSSICNLWWIIPRKLSEYYFYSFVVYKDIDANLFITVHLVYYRMKDDAFTDDLYKTGSFNLSDYIYKRISNEYYYSLNREEHFEFYKYVISLEKNRTSTVSSAIGNPYAQKYE